MTPEILFSQSPVEYDEERTDTRTEKQGCGNLCPQWQRSNNYYTTWNLSGLVLYRSRRRGWQVLVGSFCRGAVSGCQHPGGGSSSWCFLYPVNICTWTRGRFFQFQSIFLDMMEETLPHLIGNTRSGFIQVMLWYLNHGDWLPQGHK